MMLNISSLLSYSSDKVKQFCSNYWKNKSTSLNLSDYSLSYEMEDELREISNPYDYFA